MSTLVGVETTCTGCGLDAFVPSSLCRPDGTVRCSWCRTVIKRDVRTAWLRLVAFFADRL